MSEQIPAAMQRALTAIDEQDIDAFVARLLRSWQLW
jgi:hypothetical protein